MIAVSICIPAYHARRYLGETLACVREQQFTDWELIVTEDGSDDGTAQLVRDFAASVAQPVRYERHEKNLGLPATRNTGIASARAAWIALLDSDDLWMPEHLGALIETAKRQPTADLIHAGSILFDSDSGRELERRAPSPEMVAMFPLSLFDRRYVIQPASVMFKKSLWQQIGGFNPAFRYVEDREMWLRCARAGAVFAYTGRETCRYRKHQAALSAHAAEMAEASAEVFDQHLDWEALPTDLRHRLSAETWAAAGKLRQRRDPLTAARHFRRACARQWRCEWQVRAFAFGLLGKLRPRHAT